VHAKLLTGGLVPLAATLASEAIFNAFVGIDTRDALLHGHSYTAHAVGCEVAKRAVGMLVGMAEKDKEDGWNEFRRDWKENGDRNGDGKRGGLDIKGKVDEDECVWSVWSKDFVTRISHAKGVESVIALGSVLAIKLHSSDDAAGTSPFHFPCPLHIPLFLYSPYHFPLSTLIPTPPKYPQPIWKNPLKDEKRRLHIHCRARLTSKNASGSHYDSALQDPRARPGERFLPHGGADDDARDSERNRADRRGCIMSRHS
jgi:hypothetical protein